MIGPDPRDMNMLPRRWRPPPVWKILTIGIGAVSLLWLLLVSLRYALYMIIVAIVVAIHKADLGERKD